MTFYAFSTVEHFHFPVLFKWKAEEDVLPDGAGKHPRFLGGVADGAAHPDGAGVDRDLAKEAF